MQRHSKYKHCLGTCPNSAWDQKRNSWMSLWSVFIGKLRITDDTSNYFPYYKCNYKRVQSFTLQLKRGERHFPGGPLRSLTLNAGDSGWIPGWEDKISAAVWPKDKKKRRRRERKQQPWGYREKWENHGDPNLHFANEEARPKKNISNSLEIFLGLQNDCRWWLQPWN